MYINDWFKPVFPLYLMWLLLKLKFLIPMVDFAPPVLLGMLCLCLCACEHVHICVCIYGHMHTSDLYVFLAQLSRVLDASHYAVVLEIYFCQRRAVFVDNLVILCQLQLFSTGLLSTCYIGSYVSNWKCKILTC